MIRPLAGQILLCMDPADDVSHGGIIIPEKAQTRAVTGKVVKLGRWIPDKNGNLQPYEFKRGDRVVVSAYRGRWLHEERDRMKLMDAKDVLAVL